MSKLPSKLFHYCSIDSFFHIVKSKSIWLSNSGQMNDSSENRWIEQYFEIIKEIYKNKKYNSLLERAMDIYKVSSNPPFIFCLSASKDLLSQWRAYAEDGHGISIGFNTQSLKIKNSIPFADMNEAMNTIGINKVEYYENTQKKQVLETCQDIKELFDKATSLLEKDRLAFQLGLSIINWALIFKNYNFKEEKEWRIIHTPSVFYEYTEPSNNLSDLQFRVAQHKIITYFIYSFQGEFNSKLINEIVLGPKCKMSIDEIKHFLDFNKLSNTKINLSKSTYI